MTTIHVRAMTLDEYEEWQEALAADYADEQVRAGRWRAEGAVPRAREENAELLPRGLDTPRMLLLRGVTDAGQAVGRAWVALDHPRGAPDTAFLYDIEVEAPLRGAGFGRALLDAVEAATRAAGAASLELNVFGTNGAAIRLYETNGYTVTTQQMRKRL
ncbi:GNAT family N-acetyltransferase [Microbacterium sp. 179-B 1A2 NHS]|uniref:GNAT family N-acetyltransferase n=1 Tax=Microbacterium sp. 179-B 1A2 NHS TaxID=3142383 RepID=UPI00399FADA2